MINKIITFIVFFYSCLLFSQTRYVDPVFETVTSKTYNYSIRENTVLKFDLYQPENDTLDQRALFVIVHGGGFTSGERNVSSLVSLAENIAKKGYSVASIDYRLLTNNQSFSCDIPVTEAMKIYSNASEDLLSALLYINTYKKDFNIDPSKIILFGLSAGAETVLNITYNRQLFIKNIEKYASIKPAAVISISGAILNSNSMTNNVPGVFYHGDKDPIIPYDRGAHHSCNKLEKGFLIIDGSKRIVEKLESLNSNFMFYTYRNREHDIFNLPTEDFNQAFVFINKVVFGHKNYQAKIIE
jgi:predicted esterase